MHKFDKNPCMDFKGELCSERNATQRNAILPLYLMGKSLFGIPVLYFPSLCRKITESHPCLYRDMVL
ncbi:Uncharacterised protein [Neisseria gonorrhoeae]|nr:Uncharacterised protein [Neisseria gonorrhoeae]CNP52148.1 Uncharacterised protein [Neisseria gonorrhoeae]CNS49550.1 Uncharacterised protein [Neisseria gonorrhoeae]